MAAGEYKRPKLIPCLCPQCSTFESIPDGYEYPWKGHGVWSENKLHRKVEFFIDTKKSLAGKGAQARRVGVICKVCRYQCLKEIGNPFIDGGVNCEKMGHKDGPPSGLPLGRGAPPMPLQLPVPPGGARPSPWAFRQSGSNGGTPSAPSPNSQSRSFFTYGR